MTLKRFSIFFLCGSLAITPELAQPFQRSQKHSKPVDLSSRIDQDSLVLRMASVFGGGQQTLAQRHIFQLGQTNRLFMARFPEIPTGAVFLVSAALGRICG